MFEYNNTKLECLHVCVDSLGRWQLQVQTKPGVLHITSSPAESDMLFYNVNIGTLDIVSEAP